MDIYRDWKKAVVVPAVSDDCVFGDSKIQFSDGLDCSAVSPSSAWRCYDLSTADFCCHTCASLRNAALPGTLRRGGHSKPRVVPPTKKLKIGRVFHLDLDLCCVPLGSETVGLFTSFPVGSIVPLKSEVVFPSGKLGILRTPRLRVGNTNWEIRVSELERSISSSPSKWTIGRRVVSIWYDRWQSLSCHYSLQHLQIFSLDIYYDQCFRTTAHNSVNSCSTRRNTLYLSQINS